MRIATWNVNGLRAAIRKGFGDQLTRIAPDVLMLQEVRAFSEQLPAEWRAPEGWQTEWHPAEKPGYSGVAIFSRLPFRSISRGLGGPDTEGRVLTVETGGVTLVSVYLPSGSSGDERQAVKEGWMEAFRPWALAMRRKKKPVIMGGDFNIVHTARDIFYAKANENKSGYLPHEREWIGALLTEDGWHDLTREQFGDVQGPYSWWSNRGQARALDRGWRIDYLLANEPAAKLVERSWIDREAGLACSDHAPVIVDLKI